ncbi:MAG TPA: hypothetical protein VMJ32_00645 [Pirellulales bacterium]|nr:hypothetical protein [Pirellulales bacterium]
MLDENGFATAWNNELIIEIENDPKEFVWTLRVLLDIIADYRIAVFINNAKQATSLESLSDQFRAPWKQFMTHNPFASKFHVGIVLLPTEFKNENQFRDESQYTEWSEKSGQWQFVQA